MTSYDTERVLKTDLPESRVFFTSEERFWAKVDKTSSLHGCWLGTASYNGPLNEREKAYGQLGRALWQRKIIRSECLFVIFFSAPSVRKMACSMTAQAVIIRRVSTRPIFGLEHCGELIPTWRKTTPRCWRNRYTTNGLGKMPAEIRSVLRHAGSQQADLGKAVWRRSIRRLRISTQKLGSIRRQCEKHFWFMEPRE